MSEILSLVSKLAPSKKVIFEKTTKDTINEFKRISEIVKENLFIQTDLNPSFYNRNDVIGYLRELSKKGVDIKIVYDPRVKWNKLLRFQSLVDERRISCRVHRKNFAYHYLIADGKHVRLEEKHKFWAPAKGYMLFNEKDLASLLEAKFITTWKSSEEVS